MRTLSAWESMEQHSIYNCDSPDTELEFVPIQERYLGEEFKETPKESSPFFVDTSLVGKTTLTCDGERIIITKEMAIASECSEDNNYWTPTEQVFHHNLSELKEDILDRLYQDTPRERRWEHVELVQRMLDSAKSPAHLGYIASQVYKAIDESKVSVQNEETKEVDRIPTYFPKGHLKAFWKAYNLKKATLSKASESEVAEIESLLNDELTVQELKTLKQEIYKTKLSYKTKKSLWALCDTRIAQAA